MGQETRADRYPVGEELKCLTLEVLLGKRRSILGPEEILPASLHFKIFFRISSRPPSLAGDSVVIESLALVASPGEGISLTSFRNFLSAASRTRF